MERTKGINQTDLRAYRLKRTDVQVFSMMYGMTDLEAAQYLLSESSSSLLGANIFYKRCNYSFGREPKRTRAEVAAEIFEEHFGRGSRKFDPDMRKGRRRLR